MPKKPPKQNAYEVTFKNSVLSKVTTTSGGERENGYVSHQKTVLSGPNEEGTYNRLSCFVVHSKMAQSTNTKSKPLEGLYTDTDPDNRSEIITDITIRVPGKAGTMMMEAKVNPGAQPSRIPLHKFKTLFPHLCKHRLPKEVLLDNTQNEFQSYSGRDLMCYGHFLIDVKDKVTKKYHPIRFYVLNTDVPRILISHAASYWLGLVKVLCDNKAPRVKRQVASIDKKSDFKAKSGPFRTSTSHTGSSSQKKQDKVFHWEEQKTQSFQQVKVLIGKANNTPLGYYDRTLPVTVQADASLRGLGVSLIQKHNREDQPIAFASKSLTDVETRYANIERELLMIVFACQCFSTYLLGRSFVAESDHKLLEMIAMKNLANVPPPSTEDVTGASEI